jgi:hypothetical protein
VPQVFKIEKAPAAVVTSKGLVVMSTPAGVLYALPNPDTVGASWAQPLWSQPGVDNEIDNSRCYDIVLDSADHVYSMVTDLNLLKGFLYGFDASRSGAPALWSPAGADLKSNLRLFEFYHIGALAGPDGNVYVPTNSLLSQEGLAIVATADGSVRTFKVDADRTPPNQGCATGSVWVDGTSPTAAFLVAHAFAAVSKTGGGLQAWSGASSSTLPAWYSNVDFLADAQQPNPLLDPWTKDVFFVGIHGATPRGETPVMLVSGASER